MNGYRDTEDGRDYVYDPDHCPTALINIYDGQRWSGVDTGIITTAPTIIRAENQPGSAVFSILNEPEYPDSNPLSEDFVWNDRSTGPVTCGMTVMISDNADHPFWPDVFSGIISTITVNGDTITFECADEIARLGKAGSDIRRNYRDGEISGWFDASTDSNGVYAVLDDTTPDGGKVTPVTYGWSVNSTTSSGGSSYKGIAYQDTEVGSTVATWTFPSDNHVFIRSVKLYTRAMNSNGMKATYTFKLTINGQTATDTMTSEDGGHYLLFTFATPVAIDGTVTATLTMGGCDKTGTHASIVYLYYEGHEGDSLNLPWGLNSPLNGAYRPKSDISWDTLDMSVACTQTESGNKWVFRPSDQTTYNATPSTKRLYATYTKGTIPINTVVDNLSEVMGYLTPSYPSESVLPSTIGSLAVFRVGGGFISDYIGKLCDLTDTSGTYAGVRRSWMAWYMGNGTKISIGRRYSVNDDPQFVFCYGGNDMSSVTLPDTVLGTFEYCSSSLSKTLKHRADRVTYFGEISDSSGDWYLPITITDPSLGAGRNGQTIHAISSGTQSSTVETAQAAYNLLTQNELDKWEGTVTVPMSKSARHYINAFIRINGDYAGSGVPVLIYDNRIGLVGYKARIRQMTLDYVNCTITFNLNNYGVEYSSDIADSIAEITRKGTVGAIRDMTLWGRQYYYAHTDISTISDCTLTPGTQMYVSSSDTDTDTLYGSLKADSTEWIGLPNGDWLAVGRWEGTATRQFNERYGVKSVLFAELHGNDHPHAAELPEELIFHRIPIPAHSRPDLLNSQNLVVVVQIKGI